MPAVRLIDRNANGFIRSFVLSFARSLINSLAQSLVCSPALSLARSLARPPTARKPQYGIVVEVGTSHTEATLYRWEGAKLGGTGRVNQVRQVESQQVGLVQSVAPGATSRDISGLLDTLKEYVPESHRPTTPIYLLATEGMRLNK